MCLFKKTSVIKVINLVGARPQFIKASALSKAFRASSEFDEILVHSGQHYDVKMSDVFFKELGIPEPKYNLNIGSDSHGAQTGAIMSALERVFETEKPDVLVVYGDTNTTLAGALVASKLGVRIAHVEAGLRSYNYSMPEEINRKLTDALSSWLFCPSDDSIANLMKEGIGKLPAQYSPSHPCVLNTGDIMLDVAMEMGEQVNDRPSELKTLPSNKPYALLTLHRNFNTDDISRLRSILTGVAQLAEDYPVVFPVHPRTASKIPSDIMELLQEESCLFLAPLSYRGIVGMLKHAGVVITDSGGLQKEAYYFKKGVVIPRAESEWEEIVATGSAILTDANGQKLNEVAREFLSNPPTKFPELYGDGRSAARMLNAILKGF
ncbi:MAG: UDP-N-acetylglucosamine 2-epimerase (non-hydrolyzing) [Bacteroidetes bacterium]|nr:MAG: UDP-N-acetylglucosamine 2-epimerase (non-hydrolyzing) [Bacteroidota bacterium]